MPKKKTTNEKFPNPYDWSDMAHYQENTPKRTKLEEGEKEWMMKGIPELLRVDSDWMFQYIDDTIPRGSPFDPARLSHKACVQFRIKVQTLLAYSDKHKNLELYDGDVQLDSMGDNKIRTPYDKLHAYYSVIKETDEGYLLIATNANVCGTNLKKLKYLRIDSRSLERRTNKHFVGKLIIGDSVQVFELRDDRRQYYRVHEFKLMMRAIRRNVDVLIFMVDGVRKMVARGYEGLLIEQLMDGGEAIPEVVDGWMLIKADIFIPDFTDTIHSKDVEVRTEGALKYMIDTHYAESLGRQKVIFSWKRNDEDVKYFKNMELIRDIMDDKEKLRIILLIAEMSFSANQNIGEAEKLHHKIRNLGCEFEKPDMVYFNISQDYKTTIGKVGEKVRILDCNGKEVNIDITEAKVENEMIAVCAKLEKAGDKFSNYKPVVATLIRSEPINLMEIDQQYYRRLMSHQEQPILKSIFLQLHGGVETFLPTIRPYGPVKKGIFPVDLNAKQVEAIENLLCGYTISMVEGPVGSGLSTTLIASLVYWYAEEKKQHPEETPIVLVMAKQNHAVAKLAQMAVIMKDHLPNHILRYISDDNWKRYGNSRSEIDMPCLKGEKEPPKVYLKECPPPIILATYDMAIKPIPAVMDELEKTRDYSDWCSKVKLVLTDEAQFLTIAELMLIPKKYPNAKIMLFGNLTKRFPDGNPQLPKMINDMANKSALEVAKKAELLKKVELTELYKPVGLSNWDRSRAQLPEEWRHFKNPNAPRTDLGPWRKQKEDVDRMMEDLRLNSSNSNDTPQNYLESSWQRDDNPNTRDERRFENRRSNDFDTPFESRNRYPYDQRQNNLYGDGRRNQNFDSSDDTYQNHGNREVRWYHGGLHEARNSDYLDKHQSSQGRRDDLPSTSEGRRGNERRPHDFDIMGYQNESRNRDDHRQRNWHGDDGRNCNFDSSNDSYRNHGNPENRWNRDQGTSGRYGGYGKYDDRNSHNYDNTRYTNESRDCDREWHNDNRRNDSSYPRRDQYEERVRRETWSEQQGEQRKYNRRYDDPPNN